MAERRSSADRIAEAERSVEWAKRRVITAKPENKAAVEKQYQQIKVRLQELLRREGVGIKVRMNSRQEVTREKIVLGGFLISQLDKDLASEMMRRLLGARHRPQDKLAVEMIFARLNTELGNEWAQSGAAISRTNELKKHRKP
jgi:hypothetical protein